MSERLTSSFLLTVAFAFFAGGVCGWAFFAGNTARSSVSTMEVAFDHHRSDGDDLFWEGVAQGHCDRDCQYTHDGGLESSVSGRLRSDRECRCWRELGEPDWEHYPP